MISRYRPAGEKQIRKVNLLAPVHVRYQRPLRDPSRPDAGGRVQAGVKPCSLQAEARDEHVKRCSTDTDCRQ